MKDGQHSWILTIACLLAMIGWTAAVILWWPA